MKARILITAALIISMGVAHAAIPAALIFTTSEGKELVQPVPAEETTEVLPLEVKQEIVKSQASLATYHFDITDYIKPEEEEPLPFDLQKVFLSTRNYQADTLKQEAR